MRCRLGSVTTFWTVMCVVLAFFHTYGAGCADCVEETPFWLEDGYQMMPTAYFPHEMHRLLGIRAADASPSGAVCIESIEVTELEAALRVQGMVGSEILNVVAAYESLRQRMRAYRNEREVWEERTESWEGWEKDGGYPAPAPPSSLDLSSSEQLLARIPAEFSLYVRGAAAYHTRNLEQALGFFAQVLDLPKEQRLHRSVWAVFMRGMTHLRLKHYGEALSSFDAVRTLVAEGFDDPLRLAAASVGWKGKVFYENGDWVSAIRTYLDTCETCDGKEQQSAFLSLRFAFAKLDPEKHAEQLETLVADERVKKAMLAWALSCPLDSDKVKEWLLSRLKSANAPVPYADRLAWLAYEGGVIEEAKRWCGLADPASMVTEWVLAKIHLHDGEVDKAIGELSRIADAVSATDSPEATGAPQWKVFGMVDDCDPGYVPFDIKKRVQMEMAILSAIQEPLRPERCKTVLESLSMDDALGICINKMTLGNLQAYVTGLCPMEASFDSLEFKLREVLVRRLIQEKRLKEAGDFCPQNPGNRLRRFLEAMKRARYTSLPPRVRAKNMMVAADISHSEELHGDDFYTEQMWQAANLLPNNDVLTAEALYYGGNLIKYRDPKAADKFYKALVRRNPNLAIAQEADKRRWFPDNWDDTVLYTPYPHHPPSHPRRTKALVCAAVIGIAGLCIKIWIRKKGRTVSVTG